MRRTAGTESDVAERISATAAADPWSPALEGIVDLLAGDHAMLVIHNDAGEEAPTTASVGMDARDLGRFTSPEAARWMEPFRLAMPNGVATTWSALVSDRQFERSAFYNEVVRPANGFYAVASRLNLDSVSIFLAVCRSKHNRDFAAGDVASLQAVLPLFAANLEMQRRLRVAEQRGSGLLRVLDRLDTGVILLDAAMRPAFVNARAQTIAAARDGLHLNEAGLAASQPLETKVLQNAVTAAIRPGAMAAGAMTDLRLSRPSRRAPLIVKVMPVSAGQTVGWPAVTAMVLVIEPESPPVIDAPLLSTAFGFTPREAELAALLAHGAKLSDAAFSLGIGVGTARWYLKRVLEKTNTHRQAELVHLILNRFGNRGV